MSDEELRWATLDSTTVFDCPGFTVESDSVRLPDGTTTSYEYVHEPPAVVVLAFTAADPDAVVVIDEWRQTVGRINRGLPVGSVEPDDSDLEAAARRELREETGYEAGTVERLCTAEPSNGLTDLVHHYVVAHECTPTDTQQLDANESIRPSTCSFADLLGAVRRGELRDARAMLAVLYYRAFGTDGD